MTKDIKLEATTRTKDENPKEIRKNGLVPVNLYGPGQENANLKVAKNNLEKAFSAAGESSLIDLVIDGKDTVKVIIKDYQHHVVKGDLIHVDFYKVDMSKKIITMIPLSFTGVSKAVKELGGMLSKNLDHLEVKCLPGSLVHEINIDLTKLEKIGDAIRASDLVLPEGMELIGSPTTVVVSAVEQAKEEVRVEAAPVEEAKEGDKKEGDKKEGDKKEGDKKEEGKK